MLTAIWSSFSFTSGRTLIVMVVLAVIEKSLCWHVYILTHAELLRHYRLRRQTTQDL
ncbi:hypothetical protein JCM17846_09290 [Iodidimonas nitroreducens]|uniref:Uncharacterized protein n=1 Tax=Iodidimonas nitroreducens TaxID=1236968 RepID=A0A5A7N5I0_9PROT|nr:hypothetical protein JCM17846_09290 [Iodidimonas nitroreducens]